MGIPAWVWFVVAAVAAVAGVALLLRDRARLTSRNRERRRWSDLRGWQFSETDHVLPTKWRAGAIIWGRTLPGQIWQQFMTAYLSGKPAQPFGKYEPIGKPA